MKLWPQPVQFGIGTFLFACLACIVLSSCSRPDSPIPLLRSVPIIQLIMSESPIPLNVQRASGGEHHYEITLESTLYSGLAVPVSKDGYLLTAAHNVKQMSDVILLQRTLGGDYVYFRQSQGSGDKINSLEFFLLNTMDSLRDDSLRFRTNPSEWIAVKLIVVKVWERFDLALLKSPFPTPDFIPVATEKAKTGDLMFFVKSPINSEGLAMDRVRVSESMVESGGAYHLWTMNLTPFSKGDSGGPWINANGELTGIQAGDATIVGDPKLRKFGKAVGVTEFMILEAISEADASSGKEHSGSDFIEAVRSDEFPNEEKNSLKTNDP